jgi:sugar phosphate isomerase/epimerase
MDAMSKLTRRRFVVQSTAALTAARALSAFEPLRASDLGVQLYTVRNTITKDPLKDLKAIQAIGYQEVEIVYATLGAIWPALQQTSLKAVSAHVDTDIFMQGGSKLDDAIGSLKQKGFSFIVLPYVPPSERGGLDTFKKLADTLNKAGEKTEAAGLTLCYHNHAFEFEPMGGTTGLDVMLKETDKKTVFLEMDIFWVSVAGHKPVELMKKYSDRIALLHLKDKAADVPVQYNENVPKTAFKEVGHGTIDIPAVLAEAKRIGVKNYFVEQDQTPGDPLASLKQSFDYLSGHFAK